MDFGMFKSIFIHLVCSLKHQGTCLGSTDSGGIIENPGMRRQALSSLGIQSFERSSHFLPIDIDFQAVSGDSKEVSTKTNPGATPGDVI